MKKIVVLADAMRGGGTTTVYLQFMQHLKDYIGDNIYYIFVHPNIPKPEIKGVEYVEVDTHSHYRRLWFDYFGCVKYLKKYQIAPDLIISLENTGIRIKDVNQLVMYMQALPFYKRKWSLFKGSRERLLWLYTNIFPYAVRKSLNERTYVVVNTPFLKEWYSNLYKFDKSRIFTMMPDIEQVDVSKCKDYDFGPIKYNFLYPANNAGYKEHRTLMEAMSKLKDRNPSLAADIKIYFTLKAETNANMIKQIESYGVSEYFVFTGFVSRDDLLGMYKSCTGLLFPSTIESLTMPLWEAVAFRKPIICQDLEFSRYQLEGYDGVSFMPVGDYDKWSFAIEKMCSENKEIAPYEHVSGNTWDNFFEWVKMLAE